MQIVSATENGPAVYCHGRGHDAPAIVKRFAARMKDRRGDVPYLTARLLQEAMGDDTRDTGFGVFNADKRLTSDDTHGDAGIVLIDADTFRCECVGGYLKADASGMPICPRDDES